MCGINGFTFKDAGLIQKMNQITSHRGPDQDGFWVDENISLGHNRLSIIDLSEKGKQPMWDSAHEVVVIFNGEIYNFKELREDLNKKYSFNSASDTEVILYAYREYGIDCVKKFNGIFAFALWDTRTEELFLARDHGGIKPLYYYWNEKTLIFSSEIKGILAHNIPRAVNQEAFNLYFQMLYVPEPYTMFKGIKKIPPASHARFKNGLLEIKRYWQVTDFSDRSNYEETKQKISDLFKDSVRRQLISDRPVGVFLSGGIDSTAVLGAVSEYSGGNVKTFSVGFIDSLNDEKFNTDFLLAKKTSEFFSTDHHELRIGPKDIADNLESIAWHMDEPNFNATAGAIFLLAKEAKKTVAVVLGGDGGDELFGGYPRYYYSRLLSHYRRLPLSVRRVCELGVQNLHKAELLRKLQTEPGAKQVLGFLAQKHGLLEHILNPERYQVDTAYTYITRKYFDTPISIDFEKYFMHVDREGWLVDESLARTDKMTMAFGLEERVPILDYRLIELASKIPTTWKFHTWNQRPSTFQGKRIWRDAIHAYLPEHILNQKKRGWFTPMAKWMRGELRPIVEDILGNISSEYFNREAVQEMWKDHLSGKCYNLNSIWAIVMWQLWYDRFITQSK